MAAMSITLQIDQLLEGRTYYWLAKNADIGWPTVKDLATGRATLIKLEVLDRLCAVLDCEPGDILVRVKKPSATSKTTRKRKGTSR
jgi:DNA-binding Xre family transcriptional regulator